jgi:hypothetical protein
MIERRNMIIGGQNIDARLVTLAANIRGENDTRIHERSCKWEIRKDIFV